MSGCGGSTLTEFKYHPMQSNSLIVPRVVPHAVSSLKSLYFPANFERFYRLGISVLNLAKIYPFAKPSCESSSGTSHRSLNSYSIDYTVSVLDHSNSLA